MIYGLYPYGPNDLKMILWYLHPYADEFFAKEKVLLTEQGVMIYQQSDQLSIITPSDPTIGVPMNIILPGLRPSRMSERRDQALRDLPRHDLGEPTSDLISFSELPEGDRSTIIRCLTEENRAAYAINIAQAMYYLSSRVAVEAKGIIETHLINI